VVVVSIFCSFTNIYAVATGQFNINAVVGADTTPPSQPTALVATAVSSSQINLSWTASTDNVAVTGYRIYRDTVFVGTSPTTSFSDIGLSAGTTYTYKVSAVDAAANESIQSASASATTFAAPVTPPGGGGGGGLSGYPAPVIYDVNVTPDKLGAVITWKTTMPTTGSLSWGLTTQYELGVSPEAIADTNHKVTITGLAAATPYRYQIEAISSYGIPAFFKDQFTTLSLEAGATNAKNFRATAETSSILLNWNNPTAGDFSEVRILRSDSFYPTDPNDGKIIYEGKSENFTDNYVSVGTRYYYTLFVKYADGTYSSGLVADARISNPGEVNVPVDVFGTLPEAPRVHPLINALTFLDFDFIQDGKKIGSTRENTIAIDGTKNLTVSLTYEKVPEVLKTIAVTLSDPDDDTKTFSFLLRVNADKTSYIATIGPLGKSGLYKVRIAIVDFKNRGLKKIAGNLLASVETGFEQNKNVFAKPLVIIEENFLDLLLLIILILIILRALKGMIDRNRKREEKVNDAVVGDSADAEDEFKK
jgi:chitodextrinase